ncbi:MAG: extracellular solute-binding protein [Eubacteriales bacterium]|nr:extracellular solute-binding protein [Eubacteriales bacterium]
MKKRNFVGAGLCMAMAAAMFAGTEVKADEGIKLVFAQDLDTNETSNRVMNEILAEYTELTGTEIQFEPSSDYRTWLMTQFAAGQGPDVYTGIIYDMSQDYQSGYLVNFKDIYEEESAYDPGQAWKDTLPDYICERMYISADDVPGYPTATAVVRIFYNKSMLDAVGAEVPTTWVEFMEVCQLLKDAGNIPFAFPNATTADLSWLWFNNSICSQMNPGIVEVLDVSGNGYVELAEICKGMDEGNIDFTDESMMASFELMKDFSQYWTSDYNGLDQNTAVEMFARGEVAMVQAMSTKLESIEAIVGDSFEYGVMPVPVITEETYEGVLGKSVILGGQPDIIFGMNKALEEDPEKYAAALDFVQYMSSPEIQARLAEELCRIPLATTVDLPEKLAGFTITEEPLRMAWFTGINEKLRNYFQRAGQEYLSDAITVEEFAETMNDSYEEVLEEIKTENGWSAENNYGL